MTEQVNLLETEFLPKDMQFLDEVINSPQRQIIRPARSASTKLVIADDRSLIAQGFQQGKAAGSAAWAAVQCQKRDSGSTADDLVPDRAAGDIDKPLSGCGVFLANSA